MKDARCGAAMAASGFGARPAVVRPDAGQPCEVAACARGQARYLRWRFPPSLRELRAMPSVLLAGSVLTAPKSRLDPKPHQWFNLRAEGGDERVWRAITYDEDELNPAIGLLTRGDSVAIVGRLDVHAAEDSLGRKRIAFVVIVKQILILRRRSPAAVRASNFLEPPAAG